MLRSGNREEERVVVIVRLNSNESVKLSANNRALRDHLI